MEYIIHGDVIGLHCCFISFKFSEMVITSNITSKLLMQLPICLKFALRWILVYIVSFSHSYLKCVKVGMRSDLDGGRLLGFFLTKMTQLHVQVLLILFSFCRVVQTGEVAVQEDVGAFQ